jgi:hypothetical protein
VVSPATLTVMVLLVWPAAKLTVPVGRALPVKSAALAAWLPEPRTAQAALAAIAVLPERVTVKVNAVLPLLPSALLALLAAIARLAGAMSSFRMLPVARTVLIVLTLGRFIAAPNYLLINFTGATPASLHMAAALPAAPTAKN